MNSRKNLVIFDVIYARNLMRDIYEVSGILKILRTGSAIWKPVQEDVPAHTWYTLLLGRVSVSFVHILLFVSFFIFKTSHNRIHPPQHVSYISIYLASPTKAGYDTRSILHGELIHIFLWAMNKNYPVPASTVTLASILPRP